jgi:circadian clock protein KaiB
MSNVPATSAESQKERSTHHFILFVAGEEPNSMLAHQNLEALCRAELDDRYELQVVNVFEDHRLALKHRVLVTPCLVMLEPPPPVMVAGTLQDIERVRNALRLNT